ncbi:helix-turn-helix domain-containing protein [Kribbella speibonae]|uniref:XRE family transcriptional regulator n=1 Tax=Kribbella speibonae TaxID=1572660 RepID=A0A4R0IN21_9ACTN|nr:helix-turn-helix transcriptional regulator [Kribbella speibonae]TCC32668.1 XRE family transcriptional regulator [Kribbella speibonae]
MTTSPSSAAKKAQEALGLRLRSLRLDAGLTARQLADGTGWHFTRISKIENGVQRPTDADIRTWCAVCATDAEAPDLIAQARSIESMYMEFRHRSRTGLKQLMRSPVPLYERTAQFRIYEHNVIPGLFQTAGYIRAMLPFWFSFLGVRNDLEESVAARLERQSVLYDGSKTFSVVLEEACLRTPLGDTETLSAQLDRLLSIMSLPNVSLGIIPALTVRDVIGSAGFWIFDDNLVKLETPTASIEVSQPQEIDLYAKMFDHLRGWAVYGRDARQLILRIQGELV